jgi:hypothetical protein
MTLPKKAKKPKRAFKLAALLGAFSAAPAAAQSSPSYLVINNTSQTLLCSTRVPNGLWEPWFEMQPAANWTSSSLSPQIEFQCRPPVAQVGYSLKPGARYSLLPSNPEFTLVEITGLR